MLLPLLSRIEIRSPLRVALPVDRPEASRNRRLLFDDCAEPRVDPEEERNVVEGDEDDGLEIEEEPMDLPLASR